MTWPQFLIAAGLVIAGCAVLFIVELIAAGREYERRENDDGLMTVADAVQDAPRPQLRAVQ